MGGYNYSLLVLNLLKMNKKLQNIKKTIAIFDFTDCEGCEIEFLNLRETLPEFADLFEILDWRLIQDIKMSDDKTDAIFIEGAPIIKDEIETLKILRGKTDNLIALGACACTGGVPGLIDQKNKKKIIEKIYGKNYQPKSINNQPLSAFVKIDYQLPGCPVNPKELKEVLINILNNKKLVPKSYPVCFECKINENLCLLKEKNLPCLGPITRGGCGAICPKNNSACFGCWGPIEDANIEGWKKILQKKGYKDRETEDWIKTIWNNVKAQSSNIK